MSATCLVRRRSRAALAAGVLTTLALASSPAHAESFADLYLGAAVTQRHAVTIDGPAGETRQPNIGFNRSSVFGGRVGYWFESARFLGFSLDVSHFRPDSIPSSLKRFDLYVTPVAFDLMVRWPLLTSPERPQGQLQPYVTLGPAFAFSEAKDTTNFSPNNQYDTNFSFGFKAGGGLAWQLHQNIALFAEYRFTHFAPEFDFGANTLKTDLNDHYGVAGISLRF